MLLGLYTRILDTENLIELPREYQDQFTEGVYVTKGFDRNIMILTAEAFEEVFERITSVNIADPLGRLLLRMILSSAYKAEMDMDGSILISKDLAEFTRLESEAVLVGQGDYVEVWSPDLWKDQEERLMDAEGNAERFASLLVTTR